MLNKIFFTHMKWPEEDFEKIKTRQGFPSQKKEEIRQKYTEKFSLPWISQALAYTFL